MKRRGSKGSDTIDRLSDLPDPLLHHIMPRFKAREVVQTCIWSKRWKNFWISSPNLIFDMKEFKDDTNEFLHQNQKESFVDFVNAVLKRREENGETILDSFELSCKELDEEIYYPSIKNWIGYAMKYNPRVIRIDFAYGFSILPRTIFTCESLEELYLNICCWTHLKEITRDMINLPRLKVLHLYGLDVPESNKHGDTDRSIIFVMLGKIFVGSPLLEDVWFEKLPFGSLRIAGFQRVSFMRGFVKGYFDILCNGGIENSIENIALSHFIPSVLGRWFDEIIE